MKPLNGYIISINEFVLGLSLIVSLMVDNMIMVYNKIVPTDLDKSQWRAYSVCNVIK